MADQRSSLAELGVSFPGRELNINRHHVLHEVEGLKVRSLSSSPHHLRCSYETGRIKQTAHSCAGSRPTAWPAWAWFMLHAARREDEDLMWSRLAADQASGGCAHGSHSCYQGSHSTLSTG